MKLSLERHTLCAFWWVILLLFFGDHLSVFVGHNVNKMFVLYTDHLSATMVSWSFKPWDRQRNSETLVPWHLLQSFCFRRGWCESREAATWRQHNAKLRLMMYIVKFLTYAVLFKTRVGDKYFSGPAITMENTRVVSQSLQHYLESARVSVLFYIYFYPIIHWNNWLGYLLHRVEVLVYETGLSY